MSLVHRLAMCPKQLALNIVFTRPRALIFGVKQCLVVLFQVCSVGDPRALQRGVLGSKMKLYLNICSRTARLWCLKFGIHVISPDFGRSSPFGAFPPGLTLGRRNLPTRGFSNVIFLRPYFCPNILSFTAVSTWRINCLQLKSV